jgi:hypothetical protein
LVGGGKKDVVTTVNYAKEGTRAAAKPNVTMRTEPARIIASASERFTIRFTNV